FPDGFLVGHGTVGGVEETPTVGASLVNGRVRFTVGPDPLEGTPAELLDRVPDINEAFRIVDRPTHMGNRMPATTIDGVTGVAQACAGVNVEGVITTFFIDRVGVELVVSGPSRAG
ncbi:MAG TPA: hypothetical protein VD789_05845, partial [Thermomicrobiales bacterium]|nr:hypothetical protein [Thermomicrobiales bacterium]